MYFRHSGKKGNGKFALLGGRSLIEKMYDLLTRVVLRIRNKPVLNMTVQRTADELVIRLPLSMANEQIEAFLDYLEIMAILQRAQGTDWLRKPTRIGMLTKQNNEGSSRQ